MTETPKAPNTLVTDLDNTLWDWFHAWHRSFSAMLEKVSVISGLPKPELEHRIQKIHRARGTAEYTFLLPELDLPLYGKPLDEAYGEAIDILRANRRKFTNLYPGVRETLLTLKRNGILVIAYTESLAYWTEWRIRHTGLDGVIDILYSSPDHDFPLGIETEDLRSKSEDEYGLKITEHHFVPRGSYKPDVTILNEILRDCGRSPEECVYVGDSLMKDVAMAQAAGVQDVHAAYGLVQDRPEYELLRKVSHWNETDVARERRLRDSGEVVASVTLRRGLNEILPLFHLG